MKKIMLTGLGNDGYRHHYDFKKTNTIAKPLRELLHYLGISEEDTYDFFPTKEAFKRGYYEDSIWNFKNKDYDIDLFFMKKKVKMIIRTTKRAKLIRGLEKYTEVMKAKPMKKKYKALKKTKKLKKAKKKK